MFVDKGLKGENCIFHLIPCTIILLLRNFKTALDKEFYAVN